MTVSETSVVLIGPRGQRWDLGTGADGVALLGPLTGVLHAPFEHRVSKGVNVDGGRFGGTSYGPRSLDLAVTIGDASEPKRRGAEWHRLAESWWDSIPTDTDAPERCQLVVTSPYAGVRVFSGVLEDDPELGLGQNPELEGDGDFAFSLLSESSWWQGEPVVHRWDWTPGARRPFYGGPGGKGYPLRYSAPETSVVDGAVLHNPGQRPTWYEVLLTGPGQWSTGFEGRDTVWPELAAGETVRVITRTQQVLADDGTNLLSKMGRDHNFRTPVPVGTTDLYLRVRKGGPGASAVITVPTDYRSPWSGA